MLVIDEIRLITIEALPHDVGEIPYGKNIGMLVELLAVFQAQAGAGLHFFLDVAKPGLFDLGGRVLCVEVKRKGLPA